MKAHRIVRHAAGYLSLPLIETWLIAFFSTAVANSEWSIDVLAFMSQVLPHLLLICISEPFQTQRLVVGIFQKSTMKKVVPTMKEFHGLHVKYKGGPMNGVICSRWQVSKRHKR